MPRDMDPHGSMQYSNYVPEDYGKQLILRIRQMQHFSTRADMMLLGVTQRMANKSVDWGLLAALTGQRVWEGKNRYSSSSCIKEQRCSESRMDT